MLAEELTPSLLTSSVSGVKRGVLLARNTDVTSARPCGVNSVHDFLQGPEGKWACSSGEDSILLYQLMAGREFGKFPSSARRHAPRCCRSDTSGNGHSVKSSQCTIGTVYKPLINYTQLFRCWSSGQFLF